MEARANHVLVGLFVLLFVAAGMVLALFVGGKEFDRQERPYRIYFKGSVTGLGVGSAVRYRGVPVGTVREIVIDPDNIERIRVTVGVAEKVDLREGTEASLEVQGIAGGVYVQLVGGTAASAKLEIDDGEEMPVIPSRPSALDEVFANAPELLDRLNVLVSRAGLLVSPENQQALSTSLANIATFTGVLATRSGDIDKLISDGAGTVADIRQAAASLAQATDQLDARFARIEDELTVTLSSVRGAASGVDAELVGIVGELRQTLQDIQGAARSFGETSDRLNKTIQSNEEAISDFSNEGLYEFTQFLVDARRVLRDIDRLGGQIERDPAIFLFGNTQKGFEAK